MRLTARVNSCSEEKKKIRKKGDKTTGSVKRRTWFRHRRLNVWLVFVFPWFYFLFYFSFRHRCAVERGRLCRRNVCLRRSFLSFILRCLSGCSRLLSRLNQGRLGGESAQLKGCRSTVAVTGARSLVASRGLGLSKNTKRREAAHTHTRCTCAPHRAVAVSARMCQE